jgi:hypothetical protein
MLAARKALISGNFHLVFDSSGKMFAAIRDSPRLADRHWRALPSGTYAVFFGFEFDVEPSAGGSG